MYLLYYTRFAPPLPAQADHDAFRILLCVGESTTWGHPVPGHGYPEQLEQMLRKAYPRQKIRVYNLGICAITSTEAARHFEKNMRLYRPDLVIIHLGHNDGTRPGIGMGEPLLQNLTSHLKIFRMTIFSYQLIHGLMRHEVSLVKSYSDVYVTYIGKASKSKVYLPELTQNLNDMIDTAPRQGSKVILCNYFDSPANSFLRDFAARRKVPFCDMESLYREQGHPNWISIDGWHPSPSGYAAMASKIYEAIETHRMMDRVVSSPALPLGTRYQ